MKIKALFVAASLSLIAVHNTQACDIDAARMAIQSAQSNASDAADADDLDDAKSLADEAASDASSAEIYLSDCNS